MRSEKVEESEQQDVALLLPPQDQGWSRRAEGGGGGQESTWQAEQARLALQHHAARRQRPGSRDRGEFSSLASSAHLSGDWQGLSHPTCLASSHESATTPCHLNRTQHNPLTVFSPFSLFFSQTVELILKHPGCILLCLK